MSLKTITKFALLSLSLLCAVNVRAANTLKIINDVPASVADPTNIFIQLDYASASIDPALQNFEVVYPFTAATSVWTLTITSINAGNLKFGIDPVHGMEQYSKISDPDVHLMFDGLCEFSLLATDTVGYWDISNVDWIGMPCLVKCTSGGYPAETWQLGYYKKMSELIDMVVAEYQFTPAQSAQVLIHSNVWASTWNKLMAPNHEPNTYVDSPGGKTHLVNYLYQLESNSVPLLLKANLPSSDTNHFTGANPPDWQNRVAALGTTPASFTGKFQWQSAVDVNPPIPGPGLTNEIVCVLSNAACGTVLYYSTDGINPGTTYRNDSDGGLWVRYCTDFDAGTWIWVMTNVHLNCVTVGNPSFFEDWVASLANKICYSLNAGLIPTNSNPANVYTFSGDTALVPQETNTWQYPPYEVNMYNNIIVNNSDSYGMGYSDANPFGAKKVVMQTQKNGAVVELHLLDPDIDPTPEDSVSVPLAADFDGDAKADPAVFNTNGNWKIKLSTANYATIPLTDFLGDSGAAALAGDFDGDRRADPAVYYANQELWAVKLSSLGYLAPTVLTGFGGTGWQALAGDFDGDRLADPGLYNTNGTWKVKLSTAGYQTFNFADLLGRAAWSAISADFDGDGRVDPAIYQASTGSWIVLLSTANYAVAVIEQEFLGSTGYIGLAADFDGDAKADPAVAQCTTGNWKVRLSSGNYILVDLQNFLGVE